MSVHNIQLGLWQQECRTGWKKANLGPFSINKWYCSTTICRRQGHFRWLDDTSDHRKQYPIHI